MCTVCFGELFQIEEYNEKYTSVDTLKGRNITSVDPESMEEIGIVSNHLRKTATKMRSLQKLKNSS